MVQGRSTKIISMIRWIRTSRLSIKKTLSFVLRSVIGAIQPPPMSSFCVRPPVQGYLAHKKQPPPLGPPYDPSLSHSHSHTLTGYRCYSVERVASLNVAAPGDGGGSEARLEVASRHPPISRKYFFFRKYIILGEIYDFYWQKTWHSFMLYQAWVLCQDNITHPSMPHVRP